ncbi:MAG TPA: YdeI/OmpD-associated family protein [Gemmatimonadaceae bacterium]|nr:YdeI/OmpD-associated family protein [Gemmatimonadaceae bacterium]
MTVKKKVKPKPMVKRLFRNQAAWHAWLEKNHADPDGLWLHFAKKGSAVVTVTYDEALETALCFGWIDAQLRAHDADTFVRKFTPRRARSIWSKVNRAKAERLIESGRMRPPGLRAIERAREGGEWDTAYDSSRTATVSADFQKALDKSKRAAAFFAKLDSANRYAVLWRIQTARSDALRAKRIVELIAMLEKQETFHPWTFK